MQRLSVAALAAAAGKVFRRRAFHPGRPGLRQIDAKDEGAGRQAGGGPNGRLRDGGRVPEESGEWHLSVAAAGALGF